MANQIGPAADLGFVDKRRSGSLTDTTPLGTIANYASRATLEARLAAISATSYTAARLRTMTMNDLVYAVRTHDDSAGL